MNEEQENKTSTSMTTTATEKPANASIVPLEGGNFELSASTPTEMVQCHEAAVEWCRRKIILVGNEVRELRDAYDHAVKCKWRNDTLKKHWLLACNRAEFYRKMLAAFEAGYYIVPNFPATVFAIRVNEKTPKKDLTMAYSYEPQMTKHVTNPLPAGEGEYENPEPIVNHGITYQAGHEGNKRTVRDYWCTEWAALEFPANMARLHVMKAATSAMALKVFDEILMLPSDTKRHADPILIGTIICKTKSPYKSDWQRVSFMLAWHVDTRTL